MRLALKAVGGFLDRGPGLELQRCSKGKDPLEMSEREGHNRLHTLDDVCWGDTIMLLQLMSKAG